MLTSKHLILPLLHCVGAELLRVFQQSFSIRLPLQPDIIGTNAVENGNDLLATPQCLLGLDQLKEFDQASLTGSITSGEDGQEDPQLTDRSHDFISNILTLPDLLHCL